MDCNTKNSTSLLQQKKQIKNDIEERKSSSYRVNEFQNSHLDVTPNPTSSKSIPQKISVTEFNETTEVYSGNLSFLPNEVSPNVPAIDNNDEPSPSNNGLTPKTAKKFNFLRNLSKKSFRKKKNLSNSCLATKSNENEDSNHLEIPRMLRSSSVGYLSEAFCDVHNLCMMPTQLSEQKLEVLPSCENWRITDNTEIIQKHCLTCLHNDSKALSTNTVASFTDRNSRSVTRLLKERSKHRSLSPHTKNKVSPLSSCSCNEVTIAHLSPSFHNNENVLCANACSSQNCNNDCSKENISNRKHYRKKKKIVPKNNVIYRKSVIKQRNSEFGYDITVPLQTLADRKQKALSYTSENSSIGDISSNSTVSSCELKSNTENQLSVNRSGLSCRSSSLGQLFLATECSPLGLITPAVAKHKNYLFGGMGSLLGATELQRYFPDRSVTIFVATWNMNGKPSPSSLDDFLLPDDMELMPDMFVIGTQESDSNMTEFEVMLQTTIGPSHVLFSSAAFGILHLTVFLRRDLVWFCSVPEEDSHGLRPGTYFKTKGAVAISFQFFGTRILLINTHLFAHEEKLDQRIQNYKNIIHGLDLPRNLKGHKLFKEKDVTRRYDIVFWMGDLNFRLVGNREQILDIISVAKTPLHFKDLLHFDQLTQTKNNGEVFIGFDEYEILFRPTFKFDVGTNRYDTSSKQRVPSYTDRILYRSTRDPINCIRYDCCQDFKTSDHKPVWGLYTFKVRPGKDDVPLAAGLFQRDIYLEALKRRRRLFHQPSSRNCQTQ